MARALCLMQPISAQVDNEVVVSVGSVGLYSPDGRAVVFEVEFFDGRAVFEASFIEGLYTTPAKTEDIPPFLLEFDFSSTIPCRGWGLW